MSIVFIGGVATDILVSDDDCNRTLNDTFAEKIRHVFGAGDDPMSVVEHRARKLLFDHRPIV